MNPLIKWPGGKSGEIQKIRQYIPEYDRYVEPFFGGGALFFHLRPRAAAINDISGSLMEYYTLIQQQDEQLRDLLLCYSDSFSGLIGACNRRYDTLLELYQSFCREDLSLDALRGRLAALSASLVASLPPDFYEKLQPDIEAFTNSLTRYALDKLRRTRNNALKKPFSDEDLQANLITGFTCGYYMYFRDLYNAMQAHRKKPPSPAYRAANFYFIREYCYGSMFRYNANGEFNIPYGGKSYNKKNMRAKIDHIFCDEVRELFANTELCCMDFGISCSLIRPMTRIFPTMRAAPLQKRIRSGWLRRCGKHRPGSSLSSKIRSLSAAFMKRTSISSALTSATPTMSEAGTSAA